MSDYPFNPFMDAPLPPDEAVSSPKDQLTQLKGTVEHIIYANEDNGYTVLDFGLDDDVVTACGIMPYVSDGDSLILWGDPHFHFLDPATRNHRYIQVTS